MILTEQGMRRLAIDEQPGCAGQQIMPVGTGLATLNPEVLPFWAQDLNGKLRPEELMPNSHRRVWWRCERGHTWQAQVGSVTSGTRCPYCTGRKAIPGETDITVTHPELLAEWDYEKNKFGPEEVSKGSSREIWWRCAQGHSYRQRVYSRVSGTGCPYCAGKRVRPGFNDLMTTDPTLCKAWDYKHNVMEPTEVNRGSHKQVWWICERGHSYQAAVYAQIAGNGCPYCAGRKVLPGFNDLATTHPSLLKEWDYERNGDLSPEELSRGSNRKVWWKCAEGHEWQAAVFSRTREKATGCPICAGIISRRQQHRISVYQKNVVGWP